MEKTKEVSLDSSRSWSQLPGELLSLINERLSLLDLIRFSCVCPTWRSVSASEISHRRYQLPWLILPNEVELDSHKEDSSSDDLFLPFGGIYALMSRRHHKQDAYYHDGLLSFYSIFERKVYKVEVPDRHRICGTSFGWLLTTGENSDMKLFHPFTGKDISCTVGLLLKRNNKVCFYFRIEMTTPSGFPIHVVSISFALPTSSLNGMNILVPDGDLMFVEVELNNYGCLLAMVDTGSTHTLISE